VDKLERPAPVAAATQIESYRAKVDAIAAAQTDGHLDASLRPADIVALLLGLSTAWGSASPALHRLSGDDPAAPEQLARHRAAAVEAARRLLTDRAPHE